jgi:type IV pilus assembly protein PilM
MAKENAVWGIDIGQCALKALRCKIDSDGNIQADKYDFIEYPKILSQPEADPEELVQEALEQFLSRNNVVGDKVAISVPGQAGLSRFFKPPPVEIKTMPDIVKYEVKQQIPFPIEDVIWDWQQLGGMVVEGRAIDAEVGLFAMKRDAVFRALRPFDDVDVEVDVVQLSPLAIFNVVCFDTIDELPDPEEFDPENPPPSIVVMSMGTDTTDLIVTNGIKLWLRNIPIGGNHFTRHLSRELKLTQAKAEHLKRNARQSENPKAVFKAMRPVFNDLVNEVQRSLTFFQSMEKNANINEIVLLGNAAKLPGLRQYLNKQLEIDIAKASDFRKLTGQEILGQSSFSTNSLSFAPCYGLCIQGLNKGHIKTNLLPQEIVVERVIRAKKPWVLASVSALMLGLVLGLFFKGNAWWQVNPQYTDANNVSWESAIKKVEAEDRKSKSFVATDNELKASLEKFNIIGAELSSSSEGKATWLEVYSALYQGLPKDPKIQAELEQGAIAIDPAKYGFNDRKELYIDHIESVFMKDLSSWHSDMKPIHEKMRIISKEELDAAKQAGASAAALEEAETPDGPAEGEGQNVFEGTPGWVIEIRGHHFHNSLEQVANFNAGKSYLYKSFIQTILNKDDVRIPTEGTNDDLFAYSDIGLLYPTITRISDRFAKRIEFDPTQQNNDDPRSRGGPAVDVLPQAV